MALPDTGLVLAAGGSGSRLGSRRPKAIVEVAGRPLFLHSLRTFSSLPFVKEIAIALPGHWIDRIVREWGKELGKLGVNFLVAGGRRRQDSVRAGLDVLSTPLVLVHDAARPLVTADAIRAVVRAVAKQGAAVLAAPAVDTVKLADSRGRVRETPDRKTVWHAQTPQGFRRELLRDAYRTQGRRDATDDAQLVERAGGRVVVVPSRSPNFKITTREDLAAAERLLPKKPLRKAVRRKRPLK